MGRSSSLWDAGSAMTTAPTDAPYAQPYQYRRATRDTEAPIIGGVAAGLARHLGLPVLWVRVGFVVATALSGLGVALYAGWWLLLPADTAFETDTPGAESASRGGRRPGVRRRLGDVGPLIVLATLGLGAILLVQATLGQGAVFWSIVIGVVGVGLLWRQADEVQRERWLTSGRMNPARLVFGSGGWASYARVVVGVALVVAALFIIGFDGGSLQEVRLALLAGGLGVVGLLFVVGPWVFRLSTDLSAGAGRADPDPGARRRRRAPARLGAADPGPDPEARATPRRSRAWPAPRSATCGRGSTPARRSTTAAWRAPSAVRPPRSRTATASASTSSPSATAPTTSACGRSCPRPARR